MKMEGIPFETVEWANLEEERHEGETGHASWRTKRYGEIRVRFVSYSAGYQADHWCAKGHIIYCVEGEMTTELSDGRRFVLRQGMSYHVEDDSYPHRSFTEKGATLFIVD